MSSKRGDIMYLQIGNYMGDKFDVNKTFNILENTTSVELWGVSSVTKPTIIISIDLYNRLYNYCYLSEFGRYYFIDNVQIDGERVILSLSVDVWKTWKTGIQSCYGNAVRSESEGINNITDSKIPFNQNVKILTKKFQTTPFSTENGFNYVLITSAG